MSGIVYTLDESNFIVAEKKMDFDYAIQTFWGKRDSQNRRYYITVEGKEVPFKWKPKTLIDHLPAKVP